MNYIYSTMSAPVIYTDYITENNKVIPGKKVLIRGGANISVGKMGNFYTPKGVVTAVSDDDLKALEQNKVFQNHQKRGFILVDKSEKKAEKAAANLEAKDKSAPLTEADLKLKNEKRIGE